MKVSRKRRRNDGMKWKKRAEKTKQENGLNGINK